jgi:hypothetical protein
VKKVHDTPFQQKEACHPSCSRTHKIEGSQSRPAWAKREILSPEKKKVGGGGAGGVTITKYKKLGIS